MSTFYSVQISKGYGLKSLRLRLVIRIISIASLSANKKLIFGSFIYQFSLFRSLPSIMEFVKGIKPLRTAEDWPQWKDKVMDVMEYFNAVDIIEGKSLKPELSDKPSKAEKEALEAWNKTSAQAKMVLSQCVSDELHHRIAGRLSAREAWEILTKEFDNKAEDQLFRQCLDFFCIEWSDNEDAPSVLARIKNQHRDFSAGLKTRKIESVESLLELLFVSKVLHILPKRLETFKSSYLLLKANENKTINDISSALIIHERNVAPVPTPDVSGEVLEVRNDKKNKFVRKTNKPSLSDRSKSETPTNRGNNISDFPCRYCNQKGHWLKQCTRWKADGQPPYPARASGTGTSKNLSPTVNETEAKLALISVSSDVLAISTDDDWWVDNGATKHITHNFNLFTKYEPFSGNYMVTAADNKKLKAFGSGTIEITNFSNGQLKNSTLNEVWYVPGISRNLFSVLAAHDRNPTSKFESDLHECRFTVNGKIVFTGSREQHGTLYRASFHPVHPEEPCVNLVEGTDTLQLYHERWGHMDRQYVRIKLQSELGIAVKPSKELCGPCQFGKAHRQPFGTRVQTSKPGELLSGDVCGPFDKSFNGRRYLIVIKDHFSHYRFCFVAREKSAVKEAIREVLAKAAVIGHKVKEFLSDNGGEFDNEEVRAILREYGVTQRLTAPYTPQQNGAVERENRTIVEMARTFKYSNSEIKFPEAIWAELVTTAGYILNRLGKSSIETKSPHEVWFGKKPRIKHLRIVSSKCYVHIPAEKRRKMDSKAVVGYLVGYDGDERYRIYIPEKRDIVLSRDVIFHEKVGDCHERVSTKFEDAVGQADEEDNRTNKVVPSGSSSSSEDEEENSTSPNCRKSSRERRKPSYFQDYVTVAEAFVTENDPKSYSEAMQRKDNYEWKKAMDTEINSMHSNEAWDLVELPPGKPVINNKWVFRLKLHPDGTIDKYRARLVIQGCAQRPGIDYEETFSPVTRLDTIRTLLAVAATERMILKQFDVSAAFLYGDVNEEIYMRQPIGYSDNSDRVCRLKRSLYGLKQASRCWNRKFDDFMISLKFKPSNEDPCVYIRRHESYKLIVALYVDDGLVISTSKDQMGVFIEELRSKFKIVAKELSYFLGLQISKINNDIAVSQTAFIDRILNRFNMTECNPVKIPIDKLGSPAPGKAPVNFPYRSAVGALLYLARGTRFDISFTVSVLSRSLENPTAEDVGRVKKVLRYLAGTKDLKLLYRCKPETRQLGCYSDADFAGCHSTYRSTSGVVIMFADAAISWFSQRQRLVADSTCEAELVAANAASKEVIWISRLLIELIDLSSRPILLLDNEAAKRLSENPELHSRSKHILRKHFFIRDRIKANMLEVSHVESELQLADLFTKPMAYKRLLFLRNKLGLIPVKC